MVTINDVAKAAGVSRATASYALRGDTRIAAATANKVRRAASQLQYTANLSARSLRSGRNGVIGVAIYELSHAYPAEMSAMMSREIANRGCQAIVQQTSSSKDSEVAILQRVTSQLCDGMIFSPINVTDQEMRVLSHGKPMVLLDDSSLNPTYDSIDTPSESGSRDAIRHLIDIGCRNIVVIGAGYDLLNDPQHAHSLEVRRLRGCLQAFADRGLTADPRNFVPAPWSSDEAQQRAHQLVQSGRPFDGAFCMTDTMAMGFIRGLFDCGKRVPNDVAVVGFDGITEAENFIPSLTTIDTDLHDLATRAVDLLIRRMRDETLPPQHITAKYRLVVRESTSRQ